jgi:Cu/Ag efflux pump CusA
VSFSFIPLLAYYLIKPPKQVEEPMSERRKHGFAGFYYRVGDFALQHRWAVFAGALSILVVGWLFMSRLGEAWASRRDRARVRAIVASRAPKASYAWTIFKPDRDALEALADGVRAQRLALRIGIAKSFDNAIAAFDHVSAGKPGRAVLLP